MKNIILDENTMELIQWHAKVTGLTESAIIDRLLSSHLSSLWELRTILEMYPVGTKEHEQGVNLLVSFGPEPIMTGIKRIAPNYKSLEEQYLNSLGITYSPPAKPLL